MPFSFVNHFCILPFLMPPKVIVHVADAALSEASGMGRVAVHWRAAFVRRGYAFIHLGPPEITASLVAAMVGNPAGSW